MLEEQRDFLVAIPGRSRTRARRRRHRRARLPRRCATTTRSRRRGPAAHLSSAGRPSPTPATLSSTRRIVAIVAVRAGVRRGRRRRVRAGARRARAGQTVTPETSARRRARHAKVHLGEVQSGRAIRVRRAAVLPEGAREVDPQTPAPRLPGLDDQSHRDDAGALQPAEARVVPRRRRRSSPRPFEADPGFFYALAFAAIIAYQRGKPAAAEQLLASARPEPTRRPTSRRWSSSSSCGPGSPPPSATTEAERLTLQVRFPGQRSGPRVNPCPRNWRGGGSWAGTIPMTIRLGGGQGFYGDGHDPVGTSSRPASTTWSARRWPS